MATILLLSSATATRPQAFVKSSSIKGLNKALLYEYITIIRVRDAKNYNLTTTVALINLIYIKNARGIGRWYIATLIKDSIYSTNRFIARGLFSVLKVF